MRTDTIFKSHSVSFQLNQNTTDTTMDDRSVNFVMHQPKSNQWMEVQNSGQNSAGQNPVTTTITRDFDSDYMKVGLMAKNVGAISMFKRRKEDNSDFSMDKK